MILTIQTCPQCGSNKIKKNGKAENGKQKFHGQSGKAYGVVNPEPRYSEARKEEILRDYQEPSSLRGIERVFGVARQTVSNWIKKSPKCTPSERRSGSCSSS
jgi:transposase-like protein